MDFQHPHVHTYTPRIRTLNRKLARYCKVKMWGCVGYKFYGMFVYASPDGKKVLFFFILSPVIILWTRHYILFSSHSDFAASFCLRAVKKMAEKKYIRSTGTTFGIEKFDFSKSELENFDRVCVLCRAGRESGISYAESKLNSV